MRSTGRSAVSLLSPAAPEASACSAAGIHWALEDLVASCLHHRQWHEVQARSKLVHACLSALAPPDRLLPALHEVGVCHRLCPVSFLDFVCLFGFARLFVSAPSRLRASSCLSRPCSCLLHTKSVFVTGYALCHFPTSCDFPTPWPHPRVTFRGRACARVAPRVSVRGRAPAGTPTHQRTCSAGAGFPTPALPGKRT